MSINFFSYLCIFLFSLLLTSNQKKKGDLIWEDKFETKNSRWEWNYNSGTGYKKLLTTKENISVVECGISSLSSSKIYSDCSLLTFLSPHEVYSYETRLKFSNNNGFGDLGRGTKGFGFWDGEGNNFAWFISFSPESSSELIGFQAQTRTNGGDIRSKKIDLDLTKWHIYKIVMTTEVVKFLIDGKEIALFPNSIENLTKCSIWIDNYQVNDDYSREFLDIKIDEWLWVDWVRKN